MSANLTQQFHKAEQAYRRATTPHEELEFLQRMLKELPRHKGTEKMQSGIKQKISRVKKELASPRKGTGSRGYRLPRQGAGRAVIIGGPNAGKSQLLATLTNARPEIAEYPFTTREPQPGMMPWEDASVQLVDTPPITADVFEPVTLELIRSANLVLLMLNLGNDEGGQQLRDVWRRIAASHSRLGRETGIDENDIGTTFTQTVFVMNKIDLPEAADRIEFFRDYIDFDLETMAISALDLTGIEPLRNAIYQAMNVVRVYTKMPNRKDRDPGDPFTLPKGSTVLDVARMIHKDVASHFKSARVWGPDVHDGTQVRGDYIVRDQDVVELHT